MREEPLEEITPIADACPTGEFPNPMSGGSCDDIDECKSDWESSEEDSFCQFETGTCGKTWTCTISILK